MQYWLNRESESLNLFMLTEQDIVVASVKEQKFSELELALKNNQPLTSLYTECSAIKLGSIAELKSTTSSDDLTLKTIEKKSDEVILCFEDLAAKQDFLAAFNAQSPAQLTESTRQMGRLSSAFWPFVSLCCALLTVWMFIDKLPKITYVVGGLWAAISMYMLYDGMRNPPLVTRWSNKPAGVSATKEFLSQGYALAIVMGVLMVGHNTLPDDSGLHIIHEYAAKEILSDTNIAGLIEKGGDLDYVGEDGQTALFLLIDQADTRARDVGTNIAIGALTKATLGVSSISKSNVKNKVLNVPENAAIALIKNGADVNAANADGITPLHFAIEQYAENALTWKLFEALLESGASTDFRMLDGEMTPVEYAKEYVSPALYADRDLAALLQQYQH